MAPAPMNFPVAKTRRSAIPTLHQALGAFRWIVGRLGEGMPTNKGPAPPRLSKKKTPRPKSRGVFFGNDLAKAAESGFKGRPTAAPQAPDKRRGRRRSRSLYIFCLNSLATATISRKAETVSSQPRVFKPQSGLIHSLSAGITRKAFSTKPASSLRLGTRGLWMS